jgi:predicted nucleic acid-binding protein
MKPICLDSSGWIEVTHAGPNAQAFLEALADPSSLIVPMITLYEVRKYSLLHADEARTLQITQFMEQGQVIPLDATIAELGVNLSIKHKLAMADALIYATARSLNATLWTQDADFKDLPHVKYFAKQKS